MSETPSSNQTANQPSNPTSGQLPKQPADQVFRMYTPRRGVVRLSRLAVVIVAVTVGLILGGAIMLGLKKSKPDNDEQPFADDFGRASPQALDAGPLGRLPMDYRYSQDPPKAPVEIEPEVSKPEPVKPTAPDPVVVVQPPQVQPPQVETPRPQIDPELIKRIREMQMRMDAAYNSPIVFGSIRSRNAGTAQQQPANLVVSSNHDDENDRLRFGNHSTPVGDDNNLTFFRSASSLQTHVRSKLEKPRSPYEIQAGTVIPGALVTALQSDLPGLVVGQVTEHVYDTVTGKHLLVPQGSRLIGQYNNQLAVGQDRLFVVWQRLILPNGNSIVLESMPAADPSGASGLKDQVDHHIKQVLGATVLSSLIAYGGNLARGKSDSRDGLSTVGETVAQQASRVGQRIVDRQLNVQPTVTIRAGWPFVVLVNKDMTLQPFKKSVR